MWCLSSSVCSYGELTCHCVFAADSSAKMPLCSSLEKRKSIAGAFFFFLKHVSWTLNCIFFTFLALSTHVTMCNSLRVSTASTSFFLPGFVRHTHTHTLCKHHGWKFSRCFLFVVLLCAGLFAFCLWGLSAEFKAMRNDETTEATEILRCSYISSHLKRSRCFLSHRISIHSVEKCYNEQIHKIDAVMSF